MSTGIVGHEHQANRFGGRNVWAAGSGADEQHAGRRPDRSSQLREAVAELEASEDRSPAAAVRLGVCYYLLGRYWNAVETLQQRGWRRAGIVLSGPVAVRSGAVRPRQ